MSPTQCFLCGLVLKLPFWTEQQQKAEEERRKERRWRRSRPTFGLNPQSPAARPVPPGPETRPGWAAQRCQLPPAELRRSLRSAESAEAEVHTARAPPLSASHLRSGTAFRERRDRGFSRPGRSSHPQSAPLRGERDGAAAQRGRGGGGGGGSTATSIPRAARAPRSPPGGDLHGTCQQSRQHF